MPVAQRRTHMFAVYATHADPNNPLAALKIGDRPEPSVPEGWTRVKISHASLNRHDLFTLRGITAHPEGITYPMILGNDADHRIGNAFRMRSDPAQREQ